VLKHFYFTNDEMKKFHESGKKMQKLNGN